MRGRTRPEICKAPLLDAAEFGVSAANIMQKIIVFK